MKLLACLVLACYNCTYKGCFTDLRNLSHEKTQKFNYSKTKDFYFRLTGRPKKTFAVREKGVIQCGHLAD